MAANKFTWPEKKSFQKLISTNMTTYTITLKSKLKIQPS